MVVQVARKVAHTEQVAAAEPEVLLHRRRALLAGLGLLVPAAPLLHLHLSAQAGGSGG